MTDQQFCLRWNNHQSTLISVFDSLLENGTLVDCTLAAEGKYLKAHKVVLSACSPYLETLLSQHYEKHPIVILKDVKFTELKSMMDYMYRGEVNISQDQLGTFLKAAESLQIKGLSDNGSDGDGRDVGSTSKVPPPRKTQPAPSTHPADIAPASPTPMSREGSVSPSSRKRRRIRRNSQSGDSNMGDSHLDSNSCDLPNLAQSTPIVPNIPTAVTSSITTTPIKPEQTDVVNRIDSSNLNSLPPESGLLKEKIEPISEPLLEPKTEYLEDVNNEDSVEDLTLDDDDEMDEMDMSNMSNMSNMSRPGPSHANDISQMANQGFVPWQMSANQTGTDEVFMAAQEAVQSHRGDSQDGTHDGYSEWQFDDGVDDIDLTSFLNDASLNVVSVNPLTGKLDYICPRCSKIYSTRGTLVRHLKFECGQKPKFSCPHCSYKSHRKDNIKTHLIAKHEISKKVKCPLCERAFVHKSRMQEHLRLFHKLTQENMIPFSPVELPTIEVVPSLELFSPAQIPCTSTPKKRVYKKHKLASQTRMRKGKAPSKNFKTPVTLSDTPTSVISPIKPCDGTEGGPTIIKAEDGTLVTIKEEPILETSGNQVTPAGNNAKMTSFDVLRVIM